MFVDHAAVAALTPGYARSATSTPDRLVAILAIRQARSLASLPELTNTHVSSPSGIVATSRSASATACGCR
ncbi:hypothetical protein JOF29_007021 [Kribbella aluminosa]|uniref:Uncharacterized protein n=1 Tax=Kribbella aluminosa TaxID=416017 RepID=A0ABS4UWA7_9ACTN|nr:hypothetical protein [Kribbella aluminosa]